MEFHFRMYGVSRRMCYVRVTHVWRMKCTRDVSTAYVYYVPFLPAMYLFCTSCFLIPIRTNGGVGGGDGGCAGGRGASPSSTSWS